MAVFAEVALTTRFGSPRDAEVFYRGWFTTVPRVGTYLCIDPEAHFRKEQNKRSRSPDDDVYYIVRWQCWYAAWAALEEYSNSGVLLGVEEV